VDGGREIDDLVSTVNVFPTLLEIARVPIPDDRPLDGRTFLP
jgi:arylsulfatase A-like enzyme